MDRADDFAEHYEDARLFWPDSAAFHWSCHEFGISPVQGREWLATRAAARRRRRIHIAAAVALIAITALLERFVL